DKKRILPCASYCDGEFGLKGLFVGVPTLLGAGGVEKVVEIDLDESETKLLKESAEHVAELVEVVKNLDPSLG
ncbi:MAG: malate dehydrogenase, partial [Phycisphaeraceae bacterium]